MNKTTLITIFVSMVFSFSACHTNSEVRLKKQMKKVAESYLDSNAVSYQIVDIESVDTVTEMGYANLNRELISQMEESYMAQYEAAIQEGNTSREEILRLYLKDITNTREDFEDLMSAGSLKSDGVLLYMVTGRFKANKKDETGEEFMFLVNPDKKTIHNLDPFGNNLLYKDEQ